MTKLKGCQVIDRYRREMSGMRYENVWHDESGMQWLLCHDRHEDGTDANELQSHEWINKTKDHELRKEILWSNSLCQPLRLCATQSTLCRKPFRCEYWKTITTTTGICYGGNDRDLLKDNKSWPKPCQSKHTKSQLLKILRWLSNCDCAICKTIYELPIPLHSPFGPWQNPKSRDCLCTPLDIKRTRCRKTGAMTSNRKRQYEIP